MSSRDADSRGEILDSHPEGSQRNWREEGLGSSVRVALFTADGQRQLKWSPVDIRGTFLLEGLPAGNYWLELSAFLPEQRKTRSVRQQVEVGYDKASDVVVTLDLNPGSSPKPTP